MLTLAHWCLSGTNTHRQENDGGNSHMFCNCIKNKTKHEQGVWITVSRKKHWWRRGQPFRLGEYRAQVPCWMVMAQREQHPIRGTAPGVTWRRKKEKSRFRERKSLWLSDSHPSREERPCVLSMTVPGADYIKQANCIPGLLWGFAALTP